MKRALFLVLAAGIGCAGMKVKQDYDTSVDFQRLKTYGWKDTEPADSLMENRIRKAADSALAEKGYTAAADGQKDFLVVYRYTVENLDDPDKVRTGIGVGGGSGGVFGGVRLGVGLGKRHQERETLTLSVLDPSTGKLIWKGSTQNLLSGEPGPEKTTKRIEAAVKTILSKFPPKQ
jgi:hypothetical protein